MASLPPSISIRANQLTPIAIFLSNCIVIILNNRHSALHDCMILDYFIDYCLTHFVINVTLCRLLQQQVCTPNAKRNTVEILGHYTTIGKQYMHTTSITTKPKTRLYEMLKIVQTLEKELCKRDYKVSMETPLQHATEYTFNALLHNT